MGLKNYKSVFILLITALLLYLLHKVAFSLFGIDTKAFYYSVETLYLFFSASSLVILLLLLQIKARNPDQFGMAFIWVTGIKIMICCLLLIPLFAHSITHKSVEKMSFFVTFILFLAIETILSIRILNNKQ